jgi:hypothetical protein
MEVEIGGFSRQVKEQKFFGCRLFCKKGGVPYGLYLAKGGTDPKNFTI